MAVLTSSSVASLDRVVQRLVRTGSFLLDVSREVEFNHRFEEYLENFESYNPGGVLESELNVWTDFFRFMPNDAGGIMSHINTLMEQEHGRLVHDWKRDDGDAHQMEQLIGNVQRFRRLCKDFRIQYCGYSTVNTIV